MKYKIEIASENDSNFQEYEAEDMLDALLIMANGGVDGGLPDLDEKIKFVTCHVIAI